MVALWMLPPNGKSGVSTWWRLSVVSSFYIFAILFLAAIIISLLDRNKVTATIENTPLPKTDKKVKFLFVLLGLVILSLYIIFNGH
jgi:SSS family solute:Na+ symporter